MAVTINGIFCNELVDSYTESYDIQSGPSAIKGYICGWADRFTVIHGILGLQSTPALGGLITLNLPMAYPELAAESTNALASMYARSVQVYGKGPPIQGANNIAFTSAVIYVTFGSFPWTFSGIDFFQLDPVHPYIWAEQNIDFSSEWITVPGKSVFFKTTPARLDQPYGFFSPMADMSITLKNVPYLPSAQILSSMQAPINSVAYLQCNPGFLMFKGGHSHRVMTSDGTQAIDLELSFSFRSIARWDQVYHGAANAWDQVVNASGTPIIGSSDLSVIIPSAYNA
jgi:hypothetical protein